jgi:hypothetical protein
MLPPYKNRFIRFAEMYTYGDWHIKIYSISAIKEYAHPALMQAAKQQLPVWLKQEQNYAFENYKIATLIVHEGLDGAYAIINWWMGENMLQQHVYTSKPGDGYDFSLASDKGLFVCVWEMAVLCHERDAWLEHVLKKPFNPRFDLYLQQQLNCYV